MEACGLNSIVQDHGGSNGHESHLEAAGGGGHGNRSLGLPLESRIFVGLGWGLAICISALFPGDMKATVWGPHTEGHAVQRQGAARVGEKSHEG